MSTLDNLRKEAKRWLKALRAGASDARARLGRAYADAPHDPGLRDVQHALAREHGHESWAAMTTAIVLRQSQGGAASGADAEATGGHTHAERVATFLEFACWDHRVHGTGDHRMHDRAAQRLLAQHPDIARDSLSTAVVCGGLEEVARILAQRPAAAREPGGSRGWTPLLYLCYTRFSHQPTIDNAVAIGRALLDHDANPNDFYMAGDARYSALVGVAGEGEQDSPRQPQAKALFQLLLDRGAEPFDIQVLYNTHFSADMLWWLELIHAHTMKTGRTAEWQDPAWSMLDMGGYGPGAYFLLWVAVGKNNLELAEWLLTRGASPNAMTSHHTKFKPTMTHYQVALREGFTEMADLLVRYGATPVPPVLDEQQTFIEACFRLDRAEALAHLEKHPEYLHSPAALFAAARKDRADVVQFLLDIGVPIEVEDEHKQRALHEAAGHHALGVAKLLVERGAEIDPRETNFNATPIGLAAYGDRVEMVEFLSRFSRNVWTLTFRGYVDRLRELLQEEPALAKVVARDGTTPLLWLPDDEAKAIAIVELFLSHGADPSITNKEGETAADWALKRGMLEVARKLGVYGTNLSAPVPAPAPDLERYESLAQDLLFAYETGHGAAIQRLQEYAGRSFTWEELRSGVRQRLDAIPDAEKPDGHFALAHARLVIARQAGFDNWPELLKALEPVSPASDEAATSTPSVAAASVALSVAGFSVSSTDADVPIEMRTPYPVELQDHVYSTTTDVWDVLTSTRDGNLDRVNELISRCPSLVHCDYNYMVPLHLAVREGHLELVRYLLEQGAANPKYVTYPYGETLLTMAQDRGFDEIAQLLSEYLSRPDLPTTIGDSGDIKYGKDETQRRFQKLVNADALGAVAALLKDRPELALDETAFWSEGILMMPAKGRQRKMLELLMRYGARVSNMSKWGREYYFKHYDIAVFLMENGMHPNHMNCHRTTLLHDMAQEGDLRKARLLLDHGADVNAVDLEFRSTPLGLAARWGQRPMVAALLERGADPNRSGAPWATPIAWSRKKGHAGIEADLRKAGAR